MSRIIPIALTACLGMAAASLSPPADAGVAFGVTVPLPGAVIAAPPALVTPWPYAYAGRRYFYPGYAHYGYAPYAYRYGVHPGFRPYGYWHRGWR